MIHSNILSTIGQTPLVSVNRLNPNPRVRILAKIEYFNPGGSSKDRVAMSMIEAAERAGLIQPGKTIIEATSGNTGIGLAMVCAVKGYPLKLLMPATASEERKKIMLAYGAQIQLTPGHLGTDGAIEEAYRLAREEPDAFVLMDQFNNPASIEAHYATTGLEIWEQTGGQVTHVVVALGTTGTAMGVARRLHQQNPDVRVLAIEPYAGHRIQGLKNMQESYPPGIYDKRTLDRVMHVDDERAFETARRLAREEGLLVGMSSGAAMAGALALAEELESGLIVAILPDSGERYLSTTLFAGTERKGLKLWNLASAGPVSLQAGARDLGLFTLGPALDGADDLDAWRRIVLLDVLVAWLESRKLRCRLVVGLADMDDRAMQAARQAGLPRERYAAQALRRCVELAGSLGLGERVEFHLAGESVETILGTCRKLLAKGAAYEKLRSVYFDVLRYDKYGQLSAMDLDKLSLGKTVDMEAYAKDNPKDFTLLKRASLQDLKSGECLHTEWGNVRPGWFVQHAAVAMDRLPAVDVFMAGEAHSFPHLENFRGIWSLARAMEPQAWLVCRGIRHAPDLALDGVFPPRPDELGALRMWLLSTSYSKPLSLGHESLTMWRKNWLKVQHLALDLCEHSAEAGPKTKDLPPVVEQALAALEQGFTADMEDDLHLHRFWPRLFAFCRDIRGVQAAGDLHPAAAAACLERLKAVDAVLRILDLRHAPTARPDWPAEVADLVAEREQARQAKDFNRADALRERILQAGFTLEDAPHGTRLYRA